MWIDANVLHFLMFWIVFAYAIKRYPKLVRSVRKARPIVVDNGPITPEVRERLAAEIARSFKAEESRG